MKEFYCDYKEEKKLYKEMIVIIKDRKEYYTYNQDKEVVFSAITMMKIRVDYKILKGGLIIYNDIDVLEKILNKLNMKYIILDSKKSLNEIYIKYLNYNSQNVDKCENCKYLKNGECYGIEKTKDCKDFKKVNFLKRKMFNNNSNYSKKLNNGFLLLGSYYNS